MFCVHAGRLSFHQKILVFCGRGEGGGGVTHEQIRVSY